jgi:hypothetical protein
MASANGMSCVVRRGTMIVPTSTYCSWRFGSGEVGALLLCCSLALRANASWQDTVFTLRRRVWWLHGSHEHQLHGYRRIGERRNYNLPYRTVTINVCTLRLPPHLWGIRLIIQARENEQRFAQQSRLRHTTCMIEILPWMVYWIFFEYVLWCWSREVRCQSADFIRAPVRVDPQLRCWTKVREGSNAGLDTCIYWDNCHNYHQKPLFWRSMWHWYIYVTRR